MQAQARVRESRRYRREYTYRSNAEARTYIGFWRRRARGALNTHCRRCQQVTFCGRPHCVREATRQGYRLLSFEHYRHASATTAHGPRTGAKVNHVEALFITWSLNVQHSALVLRLMRNRAADLMLQGTTEKDEALRNMSGWDVPAITEDVHACVTMTLLLHHTRRKLVARDARSVAAAYMYEIKFKLPWLFGLRACPLCPTCDYVDDQTEPPRSFRSPFQEILGHEHSADGWPCGAGSNLRWRDGVSEEDHAAFPRARAPHQRVSVSNPRRHSRCYRRSLAGSIHRDSIHRMVAR